MKISITIDKNTLKQIDDYRKEQVIISTRSKAIRELILKGIEK